MSRIFCTLFLPFLWLARLLVPRRIFDSDKAKHKTCIALFFLCWVTTVLPVLIVILADLLAYDPTRTGLSGVGEFTERGFASLLKNFQLGKVFIYTSSYLAPAIIVIWKYNEKSDRFKEWYKFVIAISALAIISAVMYLSSSSGSTQNHTFELFLGLIIYVFSALYLYGAILEDRDIDDLIAAAKLEVNKRDKAVDGIGSDLESFNP